LSLDLRYNLGNNLCVLPLQVFRADGGRIMRA